MASYNGWTNRETWNVSLWLRNEESYYFTMREMIADRVNSSMVTDEYVIAEMLREYVEEITLGDNPPASLATDIITHALGAVDWHEIALSELEEYERQDGPHDDCAETLPHYHSAVAL